MPHKLRFKVVFASGEEDRFRASELDDHGPAVRGWQSQRNCPYPQEIILRLDDPAPVHQVQILSHQYMIAERIELWTCPEEEGRPPDLRFDYLGYITLGDNRSTEYRSRELKSINLPGTCRSAHVKLSLHVNHSNNLNRENQVSLVAVQLLGEEGESVLDDLAFEMYVDKEVAGIVRRMEKSKSEAVKSERFTYAGKLKAAMLALREVGEKLGRLEVGKWQAIAAEDYQRANRKKEQMEALRKESYALLAVEELLEEHGPLTKNDEGRSEVTDSNTTLSEDNLLPAVTSRSPEAETRSGDIRPSSPLHCANGVVKQAVTPVRTGSLRRRDKSATRNSYEAYDERALPAPKTAVETPSQHAHVKMNDREKKQAALAITVFGAGLVEKFYSRQYPDKEEGLRTLETTLRANSCKEGPNKTSRAAVFLLHRALKDKVFSVYSMAASLVTYFFSHYITGRVSTAEVTRSVEKLLPELLSKSGDGTPRVHNTAVHTVLSMAHSPELRKLHIVPVYLTRALASSTHPRLALSRLEMVEQLVLSLGISNDKQSGMTCRALAELGSSGLHHPAEPVRKVAERVLVEVYRVNPRLVRKQLPPDDDITRRNLLYRHLMTEFDKIDLQRREETGKMVRSGSVSYQGKRREGVMRSSVSTYAANAATTAATTTTPPRSPTPQDKQCIFCGAVSESFGEEGLNIHYWKCCPLLVHCLHCQEVCEVATLSVHLTGDCRLSSLYSRCPLCGAAVEADALEKHALDCTGATRCPFCSTVVDNDEISWRSHLGVEAVACTSHPRYKRLLGEDTTLCYSLQARLG